MFEIHTWWPGLSISAKHALREHPNAEIPEEVRAEIEQLTGQSLPLNARLSKKDVEYIKTQREPVD